MFKMSENTNKNSQLEALDITGAEQLLQIGIQDEYADKIAAEYIEKLANAKHHKDSVLYKSSKMKEHYRNSDLYKSINRIINQLEPLRLIIKRETIEMQDAAEAGNKESEQKIMKVVAQRKAEHSKLEKQLSALMSSADKLQLAS